MLMTIMYTIYNVIKALINSIGKKWDNELNAIWVNQFNYYIKTVWLYILTDIIIKLIF